MIETIKTLPDEDRRALEGASWHKQLGQIFAKIGEREAQAQSLDGVLVLIFDDPSYKHVEVTPWSSDDRLPLHNENAVRKAFLHGLPRRGNQGLIEMVQAIRRGFEATLDADAPSVSGGLAVTIAGLFGVWILALLLRSRLTRSAPAGERPTGTTGHEQVLPGMFGDMFGTLAASWIYDKSLRQGPELPPPPDTAIVVTGFPIRLRDPLHHDDGNLVEQTAWDWGKTGTRTRATTLSYRRAGVVLSCEAS